MNDAGHNHQNLSPDQLAQACAHKMWELDPAPKSLGMKLGSVGCGRADISMLVRGDMINGHKICHGGYLFTLADSAFAYACNGYNQITVAQHCTITFLKPAKVGDLLTAIAREKVREGRSGIYDITLTNMNDEIIAEFRGNSRTINGKILSD